MEYLLGAIGLLLIGVGGIIWGTISTNRRHARDLGNLAYYQKTYLQKQGATVGYGSYLLRSFDGGKNWYACEWTTEDGLTVLGPTEEIHPGLLDQINGFRALVEYVTQNGPITFSGNRAASDLALLQGAGFSVQKDGQPVTDASALQEAVA